MTDPHWASRISVDDYWQLMKFHTLKVPDGMSFFFSALRTYVLSSLYVSTSMLEGV